MEHTKERQRLREEDGGQHGRQCTEEEVDVWNCKQIEDILLDKVMEVRQVAPTFLVCHGCVTP